MRVLKQSTAVNILVFMTDSSDHVTGKTGLTLTITASKAAAAFASITPTVTERVSGWYQLALTSSHTDTVGDFALHITGSGADPSDILCQVTARLWDDLAYPATSGRSMVVDASGLVDACTVKAGASGSGVAWGSGAIVAATFAADAITASAIAADAIGASELAAGAVSEIAAAISIPTAAAIADAVWDEATSGHTTAGTTGAQVITILNAQTTQLDGIVTDTEDIQSRLPTLLGANGNIKADVRDYSGTAGTFAAGRPEVNTTHIAGSAVSTSSAQIGVNVVNAGGTAWGSGAITAGVIAADAIGASELAADAASEIATAVLTTAMTESYATDGSTMTLAQGVYMIFSALAEFSISSTTLTCKKLDGSTTAMTFTLDSATDPTSRTRAS